jgi:hypothetical protein
MAGILAIFFPNFWRNSAGIIEIRIFQKFLPFPVFLVYNFKLLSNFLSTFLVRRISSDNIFEKNLQVLKLSKKAIKFPKNTNFNDSRAEIPRENHRNSGDLNGAYQHCDYVLIKPQFFDCFWPIHDGSVTVTVNCLNYLGIFFGSLF